MSLRPLVLAFDAVATQEADGIVGEAAVLDELSCRAACIATSILANTPAGILAVEPVPARIIEKQVEAALADGGASAARVGHLLDPGQVELVAALVEAHVPEACVYAPLVRHSGNELMDAGTLAAARGKLFGRARVVAVRSADVEALGASPVTDLASLRSAAESLRAQGARAVIVGGFLSRGRVIDLVDDGGRVSLHDTSRIVAPHIPGLAGAYATALAAHLARGAVLDAAAEAAQRYVGLRLMRGR